MPSALVRRSCPSRSSIRVTACNASRKLSSSAIASGGPAILVAAAGPDHERSSLPETAPSTAYRFTPAEPLTRFFSANWIVGRRVAGNAIFCVLTASEVKVNGAPTRSDHFIVENGAAEAAFGALLGAQEAKTIAKSVPKMRIVTEYAILGRENSIAMEAIRLQRVSEQIREELTELIEYEMSDPRVEGVTVTDVHIAPDGRKARVMVALTNAEEREVAMGALENARAYLRTQVAHRLALHRTPDLQFELDAVIDPHHLNKIMKRIRKGRPKE